MKLTLKNLKELSTIAILAAEKAGELISLYDDKYFTIESKSTGTSLASQVVTEVDIKSQEIILQELQSSISTYDLGLLTEESEDNQSRFEKDYFWCIDPLDGTLPFTEKKAGYAVSIALVTKDGVPVVGIIYNPIDKATYHAIQGNGAYKNNKPLNIQEHNNCFTLVSDRSFLKHQNYKSIKTSLKETLIKNGYSQYKEMNEGGAAMNAIWVLENAPACYFKNPKIEKGGGSIWDFAASTCIFNEINAHVSDVFGNNLHLNGEHSTFMNQKGVLFASSQSVSKMLKKIIQE